jgi:hypothetical protein
MQAIGCLLFAVYGIAQIVAAYVGLDYYLGLWAVLIFIVCMFLRFTLPLTVASFLCAMNVWQWHWFLALIFAAPGLLLVIPSILGSLIESGRAALKR